MPVLIDVGKHSIVLPKGIERIVSFKLREAKYPLNFDWVLRPTEKVQGTAHTPQFKAVGFDPNRRSVCLRVQPGNTDTAWLCNLVVPNGMPTERVFNDLRPLTAKQSDRLVEEKPVRAEAPQAIRPLVSLPSPPKVEIPVSAQPVQQREEVHSMPEEKKNLIGFTQDKENVRVILLALQSVQDAMGGKEIPIERVYEILRKEIHADVSAKALAGILRYLGSHRYVVLTMLGGRYQSLVVKEEGRGFAENGSEHATPQQLSAQASTHSSGSALSIDEGIEEIDRQIRAAEDRIKQLEEKRDQLLAAKKILDKI